MRPSVQAYMHTHAKAHSEACIFEMLLRDAGGICMQDRLIRYSMQIAMLGQLLALALITDSEFALIKNKLMQDYGVLSDLTC